MSGSIGAKIWTMTLGHIPLVSEGDEPENTGRDEITILNTGAHAVRVEIEIFYADRDPVGPYRVEIEARRLRTIRFNDLIDPLPILLDTAFAAVVRSSSPVVAQCRRFESKASGVSTVLPAIS